MKRQLRLGILLLLGLLAIAAVILAPRRLQRSMIIATRTNRVHRPTAEEALALMKATSIESEVTNFARLVTNAATPERWRSWALDRIRLSAGKTNDSLLFEGVSVGREELAEFVPEQDALVAVAVIQGGTANCHLKLCWGGHETFYGIMIGTEAFRPANGNRILVDLAPGFYAYLMK